MLKPTTIRIPDKLLKELSRFVKEMNLDKSSYLREIIKKGFTEDRQERLLKIYQSGNLTLSEVCKKLNITAWEFLEVLKRKGVNLSVSLEDWLDSKEI